jgi:hypothetical protein
MAPPVSQQPHQRSPGFDPGIFLRLEVKNVALKQGFLQVLRVFPVSIIPQALHTHISSIHHYAMSCKQVTPLLNKILLSLSS